MKRTPALRRIVASAGALALGAMALFANTASAEPMPGDIDAGQIGSIIVHKHVEDPASTEGNPAGRALEGVEFTIQEVLYNGDPVPLATAEGWDFIDGLTVPNAGVAPFSLGAASTPQATEADGSTTFGDLSVGLYLIKETGSGNNLIQTPAVPFLVSVPFPVEESGLWEYNVDVYPKNVLQDFNPVKTVGDPDKPVIKLAEGETAIVPWTITVPVPASQLDYKSFVIEDVLSGSNGEITEWASITIGSTTLNSPADYTISADLSTITLTDDGLEVLNDQRAAGTTVTAVVNTEVSGSGSLVNKATVTINGQPKDTEQPGSNWGTVKIHKQDSTTEATLQGAVFEIYAAGADGARPASDATPLGSATTNADGEIVFTVWVGNGEDVTGEFWLKETTAPQGYVLPADPWFGANGGQDAAIEVTADETEEAVVSIDNYKPTGPDLPLTGAAGTLMFSILGVALVGVAVAAGVAVRRSRATH